MPGLQQLEHFVKQAALRYIVKQLFGFDDGRSGLGLELETQVAELGGKTHSADDAYRVFAVAGHRVANHAQGFVLGVLESAVVVHHDLGGRVVIHGVDGEVAPHRVFFLRTPDVVAQNTAGRVDRVLHAGELAAAGFLVARHLFGRRIVQVGAEGRDFDHLVLAPASENHVHDAKTPPDDEGPAKQLLDLLGRGVGGDIKVFGAQTQQHIAHRTADDVGLKPGTLQRAHHVGGPLVHHGRVNAMGAGGYVSAFAKARCAAGASFTQKFFDEFFDHVVCWCALPGGGR